MSSVSGSLLARRRESGRDIIRRLIWLLATVVAVTACSSDPAPDPGPRFDDEGQAAITCMRHQPQAPGARYTDQAMRRTDESLALLRYYTANGAKAYCDGAPPTDTDRSWAQLYVQLGADRTHVTSLLPRAGVATLSSMTQFTDYR